jgi:hypothetical protein
MERLIESKNALTVIYNAYNEAAIHALPSLNVDDEASLKKLLDTLMNRESISHIQHKKIIKESTELRGAIADVLLLIDGCDIQEIKANMKKSTAVEE